ncbi:MAG TPA: DUF1858 domain-containing protein [Bacteroidales bacterium]|nr:DUF1858 domain-containing protein [Bacteroidales bacterium]HSA42441.1 DUF1858 domain-containing protein [Bacteroidales bacterium]
MQSENIEITPKTRIGELLEHYPGLEPVLTGLSPAFARLKNPVLRKTLAKVASLQQAAAIGGLKVEVLVNTLRQAAGKDRFAGDTADLAYDGNPDWFNPSRISIRFDAGPLIESGGHPLGEVMQLSKKMRPGEIMELTTPFVPAPLIDKMKEAGFEAFTIESTGTFLSYFCLKP